MTKVPALVNYGTKYEVTVTNNRETFLVGYTGRKSRRGLIDLIRARGKDLLDVLALPEDARFAFMKTSRIEARLGDWWIVSFSGRTQKDALCTKSEYRYIGTEADARRALPPYQPADPDGGDTSLRDRIALAKRHAEGM